MERDPVVLTREEALSRFMSAVRAGRSGNYEEAKAIVDRVREKSGDEAAERAKKEVWAFIKSGKRA